MTDGDTCTCGHILDEHVDEEEGRISSCQIRDCPCIYYEAVE